MSLKYAPRALPNCSVNASAPLFHHTPPTPPHPPAAELHHGHGGEDAALADGAAAVPGGRPRGAQLLDPALQRRRGAEERRRQRPVEAAEPSGAGERNIRLGRTPIACISLSNEVTCMHSIIFSGFLFGPQKSTGSFCTGPCLDTFLKRSGRKLVSSMSPKPIAPPPKNDSQNHPHDVMLSNKNES